MNATAQSRDDDLPFAALPHCWTLCADMVLATWAPWQIPLLLAFEWWVGAIDDPLRHLDHAAERHVDHHPEELIVPDILKKDGEHALFA